MEQKRPAQGPSCSEAALDSILEQFPAIIFTTDRHAHITSARGRGLAADRLIGLNICEIFRTHGSGLTAAAAIERTLNGESSRFESTFLGRTFDNHVEPFRDTQGEIAGCTGVALDVTERKRAEEDRDRFFTISVDLLAIGGFDGYFKRINPAFETTLGVSESELVSRPFLHFVHPEDRERTLIEMGKLAGGQGARSFENRCRCGDGSYKWLSWTAAPFYAEQIVYVVARDITAQRREEVERRKQAGLVELLQRAAIAANEAASIEGAIQTCLDLVCNFTGWPVGHGLLVQNGRLISTRLWHLDGPDQPNAFRTISENTPFPPGIGLPGRVLSTGKPAWILDVTRDLNFPRRQTAAELGLRTGFAFPILVAAEVAGVLEFFSHEIVEEDDPFLEVATSIGVQLGRVTERERAQKNLREREESYRVVTETASDGIITIDHESNILLANKAAEEIFGYGADEMIGQKLTMLMPEYLRHLHRVSLKRYVETGQRHISWRAVELPGLHKSGREIPLEISFGENIKNGRHVFTGVIRDVAERKHVEEQLRHTAKLESLGVLAGGVAHDFNNLLTGILGNASLALDAVGQGRSAQSMLEDVIRASERAAHLTRQLLAYSGKGRFVVEQIDLSSLVREISDLVRLSIPRNVQLRLQLQDKLPCVEADATQIQQLVMNLVINGAEAIGEHNAGTVLVITGVQEVDEDYIRQAFAGDDITLGKYVYLEVTDTGSGMDEEIKSRIFDPFFTTKFAGRGLGLSAALGIVRGHQGAIKVYSTPGQGSTFKVLFRASDQEALKPESAVEQGTLSGTGTILVVDDEEMVLRTATAALESRGYTVIQASNGLEAIDTFREIKDQIALVLLDMTMPIMSGEETLRQLKTIRPDLRVVLTSGYNEVDAIRRFMGKGLAGFIQKPYTARKLAESIKNILDAPS